MMPGFLPMQSEKQWEWGTKELGMMDMGCWGVLGPSDLPGNSCASPISRL